MAAEKKRKPARLSVFGLLVAVVILLWCADCIVRTFRKPESGNIHRLEESQQDQMTSGSSTDSISVQQAGLGTASIPSGYKAEAEEDFRLHCGTLLLIDENHLYAGTDEGMTTFEEGGTSSFFVSSFSLSIRVDVIRALGAMCTEYGQNDLMVYSTTAPMDSEYAMYPDALPDRVTGYCVDLCYWDEDGNMSSMNEPADWILENAHRYGFVQSYTETDTAANGIEAAPYHLRYVGEVHATLMYEKGLSFLEYITYIKDFSVDTPLYCTLSDGTVCRVYYVEAASGTTQIPVPENGEYEISGNNVDGFVVTVME